MSDPIPCPVCGTEDSGAGAACTICGHGLLPSQNNSGRGRCARCGAEMPAEHDFCPLCGLDQRARYARPETGSLRLEPRAPVRVGHGGQHAVVTPDPRRSVLVGGPEGQARTGGSAHRQQAPWAYLIRLTREGAEGERVPIHAGTFDIGRTLGDVQFEHDPFLSPLHARLEWRDGGVDLVDLNSRNGVYLKITRPEPVYPGDHFLVGHQLLRLENVDTSQVEQPPDEEGTLQFGTPLEPAWGRISRLGRSGVGGDCYYLRASEIIFGRQSGDIIFPSDAFLSRQHARITTRLNERAMSVTLEDLGSANGTYLRLRQRASVGEHDTFRIGDQILRIRMA